MFTEEVGENIANIFKATRKFNGLRQAEFSAVLGVTQGTVSKIEAGNMPPDLGLWFKLLKIFHITDPYCFTYGGVEYREDVFQSLKLDGAHLLPMFNFSKEKTIFNVRQIRPIFDFLIKNHSQVFEEFLKKFKIDIGVFYILNHPLTFNFADAFFSFLLEHKINEKSVALLKLSFNCTYNIESDSLLKSHSPELFFDVLNKESNALVRYKINESLKSYTVSLNKKNQALLDSMATKDLVLNYSLLYPYHFLKSTRQCKTSPPIITEVKKNLEWQITYAS